MMKLGLRFSEKNVTVFFSSFLFLTLVYIISKLIQKLGVIQNKNQS